MGTRALIIRVCQVDRLPLLAAVVGAMLFQHSHGRAQDAPSPPTRAQAPPPPAAYTLQPLEKLPGQPNSVRPKTEKPKQESLPSRQNQPLQDNQAAQAPAVPTPLSNPQPSASTSPVSQQSFAPAFFGDYFNPGSAMTGTVPGSPIATNPFAINIAATSSASGSFPANDYLRQITHAKGDSYFSTVSTNPVYEGIPDHVQQVGQNGQFQLAQIPNTNIVYENGYTLVNTGADFRGQYDILTAASPQPGTPQIPEHVIIVGAAHGPTNEIGLLGIKLFPQNGQFPGGTNNLVDTHNELHSTNERNVGYALTFKDKGNYSPLFVLTNPGPLAVYSPSVAAGGIQKLVDNASPVPRDRIFFNYNYFDNTTIDINGRALSVNRLTPGFEKTFFDQRMSVEVRVPFATQVDNVNLTPGAITNTNQILLGNQATYLKFLMYRSQSLSFAGGLGVQVPTAASTNYNVNGYQYTYATNETMATGPQTLVKIKNDAVHMLPYLGVVFTPNDRFFAQGVGQFDFATNGNAVYNSAIYPQLNPSTNDIASVTTPLAFAGNLRDTNFMYLSGNTGYWIYKVRNPYERGVTGFAPTIELHYNQSLQRQDIVAGYYGNATSPISNVSNVNAVIGANTIFGHNKYLSVAYVAPLTTGTNRFFDGELRVMLNYYFGSPRVNPRFSNVPGQ